MFDWFTEGVGSSRFWLLTVGALVVSTGSFLLFALPFTWLARRDPASLRRFRIQRRAKSGPDLFWPSLRWFAVNNAVLAVLVVASWPLLRTTNVHTGALPAWWVIILQIILFIYLDDFLYYWVHRGMHTRWLFRHVHGMHHRIRTPTAITGHYMTTTEYVVTGTLMLAGPVLLGVHVLVLYLWVVIRQWEAVEGHCGYDFRWTPTHLVPGSDGAVHHDFHHAKVVGNYAGFLAIWDHAFDTMSKGYAEDVERRRDHLQPA